MLKKLKKYLSPVSAAAVFCSTFLTLGCGGGSNQAGGGGDGTFGGKAYQKVADEGLSGSDQELKGSGSVLFKDPLGEVAGEKNISLSFSIEDGGSLTLTAFSDTKLQNGIKMILTRREKTLSATLEIGTQKTDPRTLSSVDASGLVTLEIDVHNAETPVHTLIWNQGVASYTSSTAAYDSEASQMQIQGNGTAPYWGIGLNKGTLSKATVTEAKFVH
jgi:hypothetical protein